MALTLTSPDLFDRIIDVEFLGESFETKTKKLDKPREVTKQEYEALCVKYTHEASGNVTTISPKIISMASAEGPYTIDTEVETVDIKRQLCSIECGHGLKPQISLSFRMLPGQLVYHVVLKVTNLELPFDVRECTTMKIRAGYRDSSLVQSFGMGVFASYVESPGPDDVTVFEGVIVDSLDSFFTTRKVQIELTKASTVGSLLGALEKYLPGPRTFDAKSLGSKTGVIQSGIRILKEVEPEILELPVSLGKHTGSFNNGYQALNWAIEIIQKAAKNQKTSDGNPVQIFASVFNTDVVVMDTAHKGADSKYTTTVSVHVINNIKRASFVGPRLTLIAAWYPPLVPGKIFEMEPNFFNGHRLNNNFSSDTWKSESNTYRIITMEVNFDTTGRQNEMIIEALPTDANGVIEELSSAVKPEDMDANIARAVNQPAGEKGVTVLETGPDGSTTDHTNYSTGSVPDGKEHKIKYGDQIKSVAMSEWPSVSSTRIVITIPYEKELFRKLAALPGIVLDGENAITLDNNASLWSLIYIATYRAMKAGQEGYIVPTARGEKMSFESSIQGCIYGNGHRLLIPTLKSGEYKDVLGPYKDMADDVNKLLTECKKTRQASDGWLTDLQLTHILLESL